MKKFSRKMSLLLSIVFLISMVLSGCTTNTGEKENTNVSETKSIIYGSSFQPKGIDPAINWNGWYSIKCGLGETLVKINDKMEIEPWIAKEFKMVDDTTWSITIKDGIKFNNGREVKGEDIKASLERSIRLNKMIEKLLDIASINVKGNELIIKTNKPNPTFLSSLAMCQATIHDAVAAEENNEAFIKNPILTGPYKLKEYVKDSHITVVRNEEYWGDKPNLDEVTFKYIPDSNTRIMALQSGEIQIADNVPSENIEILSKDGKYEIISESTLRTHMIILNTDTEIFKDDSVRKAINMGFDRNEIAEILMQGSVIPAIGPYPVALPFGSEKLNTYNYDVDTANKLLDEAGWKMNDNNIREKDGKKLEFNCLSYKNRPELPIILEAMQGQLKDIGISMTITNVESISEAFKGDFEAGIYSMNTAPTGDPQYFLDTVFRTGADSNFGKYSNANLDQLIEELGKTFDVQKRRDIAKEAQQIIIDDANFIFVSYPKSSMAISKEVSGLKLSPVEYYMLDSQVDRQD